MPAVAHGVVRRPDTLSTRWAAVAPAVVHDARARHVLTLHDPSSPSLLTGWSITRSRPADSTASTSRPADTDYPTWRGPKPVDGARARDRPPPVTVVHERERDPRPQAPIASNVNVSAQRRRATRREVRRATLRGAGILIPPIPGLLPMIRGQMAASSAACSSASSAARSPISTRSMGPIQPSEIRIPPARAIASRSGTAQ